MKKDAKYHKKIRLDAEIYKTPNLPCFITICTKEKIPIFTDKCFLDSVKQIIKEVSFANEIPIYAYCIMPNHIHLLLSASEKQGIVEFITEFKSRSTKLAWDYGLNCKIWQKSFYDHFLRKDEDVSEIGMYILNNPVRKGLVKEWKEYKFCGSFVYDL